MTRLEELTLKLADDALNDGEACELEVLLEVDPEAAAAHRRLLAIEAALRGQRETLNLAAVTVTLLRSRLAVSVERGVMQQLGAESPPAWARASMAPRPNRRAGGLGQLARSFQPRRLLPWLPRPAVLAFAACVVFLVCLSVWFFGPTMGQPVLAEVKGRDVSIQRGTEFVPAANGMVLQPADVLRLGTNATATIAFGAEPTRLELSAGAELQLASLAGGKRFLLQAGRLQAAVARQRPFQPMIITTPQAEARVLGTKFSLLTAANATQLDVTEGKVRLTRVRDGATASVSGGCYAVAADATELAVLPQTGGLLREWWTGVKGKTRFSLSDDPRFPDHPAGRDTVPDFELTLVETNQFAVRLCGYVHPPVTGDYKFWLERPPADFAAVGFANLMMSPTENPSEAVQIAQTGAGGNLVGTYDTVGTTATTLPIPLVAGRRYYLEARLVIGRGAGELSVFWQPPGQAREVLQIKFLSPWKPK
jgi:hypothetical protein